MQSVYFNAQIDIGGTARETLLWDEQGLAPPDEEVIDSAINDYHGSGRERPAISRVVMGCVRVEEGIDLALTRFIPG